VYYNAKGKAKPLAGATITVDGHGSRTGTDGTILIHPGGSGTFTFTATDAGYIRAVPVQVRITS
jgi:hypothetical protein